MQQLIIGIFNLIVMLITNQLEKDKDKKEERKKAIGMVKEGIVKKDNSKMTAGFARHKNLK